MKYFKKTGTTTNPADASTSGKTASGPTSPASTVAGQGDTKKHSRKDRRAAKQARKLARTQTSKLASNQNGYTQAPADMFRPDVSWDAGRRSRTGSAYGLYDPAPEGGISTTRQTEISNLAVPWSPTSYKGLLFGLDLESGWGVMHDPIFAYPNTVNNANVILIGDLGSAKSSGGKTWGCLRPLILNRNVIVVDKKPSDSNPEEGEYAALSRFFGREPITFKIGGGGACLNIFDPAISPEVEDTRTNGSEAPPSQAQLLRAVATEVLGRPVSSREGKAMRTAHHRVLKETRAAGRTPTIGLVIARMLDPSPIDCEELQIERTVLREWGYDLAFELERFVDEDLSGLIDGETSENVVLADGLTVFDVSQLPETGPALAIIMTVINTWMTNRLFRAKNRRQTHFIVEEAWHVVQTSVAKVIRRNQKVSRAIGLSNWFMFHHVSDIPPGTEAEAIIKECDTVLVYQQKKAPDARAAVEMFDLPASSYGTILNLATGTCLMKIGNEAPFEVKHLRSDVEKILTDTDKALTAQKMNEVITDELEPHAA